MGYIAWCDGSYNFKEKTAYASYAIVKEDGTEVYDKVHPIPNINHTFDAEYMALYLMLKEASRLNLDLKKICIDEINIVNEFSGITRPPSRKYDYLNVIVRLTGKDMYYNLISKMEWIPRKYNLADALFCQVGYSRPLLRPAEPDNIVNINKSKQKKMRRNREEVLRVRDFEDKDDLKIGVPHSRFFISGRAISSFFKLNSRKNEFFTLIETPNLISEKIRNGNKHKGIIKNDSFHFLCEDNIICNFIFAKDTVAKANTQYLQIDKSNFSEKKTDMLIFTKGEKISVDSDLAVKFAKDQGIKTADPAVAKNKMKKTLNKTEKISLEDYDLYINGKIHIIVSNNTIQDYKILISDHTKEQKHNRIAHALKKIS